MRKTRTISEIINDSLFPAFTPECSRGKAEGFAEHTAEVKRVVEARAFRHLGNAHGRIAQEAACAVEPEAQQILLRRDTDSLCEQMRKAAVAQVQRFGKGLEIDLVLHVLSHVFHGAEDIAADGRFIVRAAAADDCDELQKNTYYIEARNRENISRNFIQTITMRLAASMVLHAASLTMNCPRRRNEDEGIRNKVVLEAERQAKAALDKVEKYAVLATIDKQELTFPLLNIKTPVQEAMDAVKKELVIPIPALIGQKTWREERTTNINDAIKALVVASTLNVTSRIMVHTSICQQNLHLLYAATQQTDY